MTVELARDVERHERVLYGGNGESVGLCARVKTMEDFIGEMKLARKEQREDARKVVVAVLGNILLTLIIFLVGLVITHPYWSGLGAGTVVP